MKTLNLKKNGFTLVEVMLVTSIFAIVVVGIILAINRSFVFMDNTRLSVRAANFAREGMEMMYNLRDTNWRKHSGDRDKYWLSTGSGGTHFEKGIYVLKEEKSDSECNENEKYCNKHIYAEHLNNTSTCDIDKLYSNDGFWDSNCDSLRKKSILSFNGEYSYYELEDGGEKEKTGSIQDVLIGDGLEFYRIVRVFGIYEKNVDNTNSEASATELDDGTPLEMRFCVKVLYASQGKHATELCGIITNFKE